MIYIENIFVCLAIPLLLCVGLQLLLFAVSGFTQDYTRFNFYFAVDIALTCSFAVLLPLAIREVTVK